MYPRTCRLAVRATLTPAGSSGPRVRRKAFGGERVDDHAADEETQRPKMRPANISDER